MTPESEQPCAGWVGWSTLTAGIFLVVAALGLWMLREQVQVFSLDDHWPDARSFPMLVLALLALVASIRIALSLVGRDGGFGRGAAIFRTASLTGCLVLALSLIAGFGFFVGAFLAAAGTSFFLGEKKFWSGITLCLLSVALMTATAKWLLHIPLP